MFFLFLMFFVFFWLSCFVVVKTYRTQLKMNISHGQIAFSVHFLDKANVLYSSIIDFIWLVLTDFYLNEYCSLMLLCMFLMFFYKSKNMFFKCFYLQINVFFNIYAYHYLSLRISEEFITKPVRYWQSQEKSFPLGTKSLKCI